MAGTNTVQDWLTWAFSPAISAILVTLLISLSLPIAIHYYLYRKASSSKDQPTFLLIGPSGAGKTTTLTLVCGLKSDQRLGKKPDKLQFANGTASTTHTSQAPQSALCQLPSSTRSSADRYRSEHDTSTRTQPTFTLLDTPGHGKLRHHAISSLSTQAALKGILFVVDSAAISSAAGLTEAAEYLHDVLLLLQKRHTQSKTSRDPHAIPVLVCANKQDVFTSLPAGLVKSKLEDEILKVRQTRSKGLLDSGIGMEDEGGADDETNWLGQYGAKDFNFSQMEEHGVDVQVVGGNALAEGGESTKVDQWWAWIGENL